MGEEEPVQENVNDADQPQEVATPRKEKLDWFKQPPRPPTPDLEWNKCQVDPLTFDELMATPIDFTNFAKNHLKLDKITKANLENPEGDRCPFDLSNSLPLKGRPVHLTVASEYFFNNNLEYLKSTDLERKYIPRQLQRRRLFSKHDVYSTLKILSVDMLLLVVQHKLFHLDGEVIVDLAVALHMPRRKWSDSNKIGSGIMVDLIDKQMLKRRIFRNLKRLVGARELEMDYRLMQRTV
ncbi:hypothetical protein Tco_0152403 [Tanacetum coccineum]